MKIFKETNLDEVHRLLFPFIDIDECLSGKHSCEGNTTCNNTIGSYCFFKLFFIDLDTNECTEGKLDCDVNAECNNSLASYKCTCKDGYEGNGTNCTGQ